MKRERGHEQSQEPGGISHWGRLAGVTRRSKRQGGGERSDFLGGSGASVSRRVAIIAVNLIGRAPLIWAICRRDDARDDPTGARNGATPASTLESEWRARTALLSSRTSARSPWTIRRRRMSSSPPASSTRSNPSAAGFSSPTGTTTGCWVLQATRDGEISELIAFGNVVPTGLAVSGNSIYVAQAGPIPHEPEDGKVVVFGPRSTTATEVAAGARLAVDVEFARGHALCPLAGRLGRPVGVGGPAGRRSMRPPAEVLQTQNGCVDINYRIVPLRPFGKNPPGVGGALKSR